MNDLYFPARKELEKMSKTDILTVDPDSLKNIEDIKIDPSLPIEERVRSYIGQIGNPYCYKSHGMVVKISFAGDCTLEKCLEDAMYAEE